MTPNRKESETTCSLDLGPHSVPTPHYVLLHGKTRIAPSVLPLQSGRCCSALFGFSDKIPYELFREASELPLTPFPLVKVYLRTLLEANADDLHLVILDATGPTVGSLRAATMQAVLEAHLAQTASVAVEYTLTFDTVAIGYRVDEG